jgi:methylthioribose-1-phosphate isomerase
MLVNGKPFRTIWLDEDNPARVKIIDQRRLPFEFVIETLTTVEDAARAIREMHVRGAGLIGATAAYGMVLAAQAAERDQATRWQSLNRAAVLLEQTRPTAVNLKWAVNRMLQRLRSVAPGDSPVICGTSPSPEETPKAEPASPAQSLLEAAREEAQLIADSDALWCRRIGEHGVQLLQEIAARKEGQPVQILTHCNAGWLAFVDYGSATAPIYAARREGIPLHVWVDETRPWNQGARLTAWELMQEGVAHSIVTDNCGGHLMQRGQVDVVLVGSDRTTGSGDVANKIGTYLKALAARDNGIPFYVALPSSSIDWELRDGIREIPIEERAEEEVKQVRGWVGNGWSEVAIAHPECPAANYVFDVTPARLVTGLITERGICSAGEAGLKTLFPEKFPLTR